MSQPSGLTPVDSDGPESRFDAIVVGAGFAGIYAVHKLREMGMSVRAFESGESVGGTWFWNRYPGARCDIDSVDYQYTFSEQILKSWRWTERYPAQPEILRYLNHVCDELDLRSDIQLSTTVTDAAWDESAQRWQVRAGSQDCSARFLILASGTMSVPKDSEIPGLDRFTGSVLRTWNWPSEGVDLSGQRVAVVGTGASGIQVVPELAKEAAELVVAQRTPNFVVPPNPQPRSLAETDQDLDLVASRRRASRHSFLGMATALNDQSALAVEPGERNATLARYYEMGGLSIYGAFNDVFLSREANDHAAGFVGSRMASAVLDPATAQKVLPDSYPFGTKRICVERGYLQAFNNDNVELVDLRETAIDGAWEHGLVIGGERRELDTIVLATGFDAITGAITKMNPRGRGGRSVAEEWQQGPKTYLGLALSGFPNMFTITGPGCPAAFTNVVMSIEHHVEMIADVLDHVRGAGKSVIEASEGAQAEWSATVAQVADSTLFTEANSWYMGANVPGKPRAFLSFLGGFDQYRQLCEQMQEEELRGFVLS